MSGPVLSSAGRPVKAKDWPSGENAAVWPTTIRLLAMAIASGVGSGSPLGGSKGESVGGSALGSTVGSRDGTSLGSGELIGSCDALVSNGVGLSSRSDGVGSNEAVTDGLAVAVITGLAVGVAVTVAVAVGAAVSDGALGPGDGLAVG